MRFLCIWVSTASAFASCKCNHNPFRQPSLAKQKFVLHKEVADWSSVNHHQTLVSLPVVRPLGRSLITVSNSFSIWVLACDFPFTMTCLIRSSLILAILSSLVSVLRCRGRAIASKISSPELLVVVFDRDRGGLVRPFGACKESFGLAPLALVPPRVKVGDIARALLGDDSDRLWSFLSRFVASVARPYSHSCIKHFKSAPIESYCVNKSDADSDASSDGANALSDSSRSSRIFA